MKLLLHEALADLDDAALVAPAPVRTAITAELEAEVRGLRDAPAEFSEGISPPAIENRRGWDFENPFVAIGGGLEELSDKERASLDRLESGATDVKLAKGVDDLRLLLDAYMRCANDEARLLMEDLSITDDPGPIGPDRYFLDVIAPMPAGDYDRDSWSIDINWWDIDTDDSEHEGSTATGEPVLSCVRSEPPSIAEIVELLNRSGGRPEQLAGWAKTLVEEALAGTTFFVTQRYDD